MPERQTTPIERIHDALIDKGYRRFNVAQVQGDHDTRQFSLYEKNGQCILMQESRSGGCEVFAPICDSNHIGKTIEAIP